MTNKRESDPLSSASEGDSNTKNIVGSVAVVELVLDETGDAPLRIEGPTIENAPLLIEGPRLPTIEECAEVAEYHTSFTAEQLLEEVKKKNLEIDRIIQALLGKEGKLLEDGEVVGEGEEGETFTRPLQNGDISRWLDNKNQDGLDVGAKVFEYRNKNGEIQKTSVLSKKMLREGVYTEDMRYMLRALIGGLISTGSAAEKNQALYLAKKWVGYGFVYEGWSELSLAADSMNMIFQNAKADLYAAGGKKPEGHSGRGFNSKAVRKWADKLPNKIKNILGFGTKTDELTGTTTHEDYAEMNLTSCGVMDAFADFTTNLTKDKADDTIEGLAGSDQYTVLGTYFEVMCELDKIKDLDPDEKKAVAGFLRIEKDGLDKGLEKIRHNSRILYEKYSNSNIKMRIYDDLYNKIGEFVGMNITPDEKVNDDQINGLCDMLDDDNRDLTERARKQLENISNARNPAHMNPAKVIEFDPEKKLKYVDTGMENLTKYTKYHPAFDNFEKKELTEDIFNEMKKQLEEDLTEEYKRQLIRQIKDDMAEEAAEEEAGIKTENQTVQRVAERGMDFAGRLKLRLEEVVGSIRFKAELNNRLYGFIVDEPNHSIRRALKKYEDRFAQKED